MTEEEIKKIQETIKLYKRFADESKKITLFKKFFDIIEKLFNEYKIQKETNKKLQEENEKLQEKVDDLTYKLNLKDIEIYKLNN